MIRVAPITIKVLRPAENTNKYSDTGGSKYDTAVVASSDTVFAKGVRASINPVTSYSTGPGDQLATDLVLMCDPTDIQNKDRIVDESTGVVYDVTYVIQNIGNPRLALTQVGLSLVTES